MGAGAWREGQGEPAGGAGLVQPARSSNPDPDPLMLSGQKGAKGLGRGTAQVEEKKGPWTRHSTISYLKTNITETMQRNKRKCKRQGGEKEREVMRALRRPQHRRCRLQEGPPWGKEPRKAPRPKHRHGTPLPHPNSALSERTRGKHWLWKAVGPQEPGK